MPRRAVRRCGDPVTVFPYVFVAVAILLLLGTGLPAHALQEPLERSGKASITPAIGHVLEVGRQCWRGLAVVALGGALGGLSYAVSRRRGGKAVCCVGMACLDMHAAERCREEISSCTETEGAAVAKVLREWLNTRSITGDAERCRRARNPS